MRRNAKETKERIVEEILVDDSAEVFEALKLTKELKTSLLQIDNIGKDELKILVNSYYQQQEYRKALRNQIRSIEQGKSKGNDPSIQVLDWVYKNVILLEHGIEKSLGLVVDSNPVGRWLVQITGIGYVLAAGLMANFSVKGANYATKFISFAGLADNVRPWLGKEKSKEIIDDVMGKSKTITDDMVYEIAARTKWKYNWLMEKAYDPEKEKWSKTKLINACAMVPYSRPVKTLMFKVGSSFQWVCNKPDSLYGRLYNERKTLEIKRNEEGWNKEYCEHALATKKYDKKTETYKAYIEGKIPKAQINMRAMRWVEKIFLSHLFEEMYRVEYDKIPPRYYTLEHMGGEHNVDIQPEIPYTKVSEELNK